MINIFDIERYATKDGPGIRTVLFFKGCRLRCRWCQNPESQNPKPQVMYYRNKCSGCGKCVEVCPASAISNNRTYGYVTDHDICSRCGRCVDACFYDARKMIGEIFSINQLMSIIFADKSFYDESGGGITFSGGEPLLYHQEIREIALLCREEGIHTAIETAASVDWKIIESLMDCIDLFFVDLKHINERIHEEQTGQGLNIILENIIKLGKHHDNVILRIPVVPGVNHDKRSMHEMLDFVAAKTEITDVELLPFHKLGIGKYHGLGFEYLCSELNNVEKDECIEYVLYGRQIGLSIRIGTI